MDMEITFPGGKKVDATYKGFTMRTDQPKQAGGDGSAAEPFSLFLASLGTCAGYYVLTFCQQRDLPSDEITLLLQFKRDERTHMMTQIDIHIQVPQEFPDQYTKALVRAAEVCAVKKHLEIPPSITIDVRKQ
ncbi:MAG: OsmC family protein [Methanobacteriota archaeon]